MRELELIAVFVFYNVANGVQSRLAFSEEFKHCNVIVFDTRDWLMLDMDAKGYVLRKIHCKDGQQLLRTLPKLETVSAYVSVAVQDIKTKPWLPFRINSCNEISKRAAGVDIGFTFNPVHLYNKLLKYNKQTNYEILNAWRRTKWDSSTVETAQAEVTKL